MGGEKRQTLIDWELLAVPGHKGRDRVAAFGWYAGGQLIDS